MQENGLVIEESFYAGEVWLFLAIHNILVTLMSLRFMLFTTLTEISKGVGNIYLMDHLTTQIFLVLSGAKPAMAIDQLPPFLLTGYMVSVLDPLGLNWYVGGGGD